MDSIKLFAAGLPKTKTILSKTTDVLRAVELQNLDYIPEQRMVRAEFESKEGVPTIALFPIEQVSYIVPKPSKEHLLAGIPMRAVVPAPKPVVVALEPDPPHPVPRPTPEQAAEIRRQFNIDNKNPPAPPHEQTIKPEHKKSHDGEWVEPGKDPTMPKPKRKPKKKKAKRRGK